MEANERSNLLPFPTSARISLAGRSASARTLPINRPGPVSADLDRTRDALHSAALRNAAAQRIASLSSRQSQVLDLVLAGTPSKLIAHDLGISQRTVDNHRAAIARKTGARSLAGLVHMAIYARLGDKTGVWQQGPPSMLETDYRGADIVDAGRLNANTGRSLLSDAGPRVATIAPSQSRPEIRINEPVLDEDHKRRLEMGEMRHRVKNLLAIVQSIGHQTIRRCTTLDEFEGRFSVRVAALCRSFDLLMARECGTVVINELVDRQLATFGMLDGSQISATGPPLTLTPEAAHNIGLALHELATNAVKYGSLSVRKGRVTVAWKLIKTCDESRLVMSWEESGGPTVVEPKQQGFGHQLIQKLPALALAGRVTHDFSAEGVKWRLDAPASVALSDQTA